MAENMPPCSDIEELLGGELGPTTISAVREALQAHDGQSVLVEVHAPDRQTLLHTFGVLRNARSSTSDYYVGGELLPTGHVLGFKAALTLPEDCWWVVRHEGGFRLAVCDPLGCLLALALIWDGA